MEMIRGRTLPEVRRYDLLKLIIAALLFINALFFCGGARQVTSPEAPVDSAVAPIAVAPIAAAPPVPAAAPAPSSTPELSAAATPAPVVASASAALRPSAAPPPLAVPPSSVTSVALEKPTNAKVYFANNKTDVTAVSAKALKDVIAWAKAASSNRLAVSGFHSASGSVEQNHELAKGRAKEVASILMHAGVPEAQIELRKPVQELGGGGAAQARRVEVGPAN